MSGRIGLVLKWSFLLFILSFAFQFMVAFIFALVLAIFGFDQEYIEKNIDLLTVLFASVALLPVIYWVCLKAAREAYQKKVLDPKQKGINITMGVVFLTIIFNVAATYLLTGTFDVKIGILPIIIAFVAGKKADASH